MRTRLKPLACLFGAMQLVAATAPADAPVYSDTVLRRGMVSEGNTSRLRAVFEKARRGEPVTVAAVGGSITAGGLQTQDPANRYIQQVAKWFETTFPSSKISFVNAGIGGTNSFYGAMRLQRDILSKKPDLVIVEWAVNNFPGKDFAESYEGALRQLLRDPRHIAVIELFFMHKDGENAQMWQEILGRHYQLPMLSFRDALWPEFAGGRLRWEDLYADNVHPKDEGHLFAGKLLCNLLQTTLSARGEVTPAAELPAPAISDLYEHCQFSVYEGLQAAVHSGWERSADQKSWESGEAGASIEFEFKGQSLFLGYDFDKAQAPQAVFSIDGGQTQPLKEDAHRRPLAVNLSAGVHRLRVETQRNAPVTGAAGKLKIWGVGGAESGAH